MNGKPEKKQKKFFGKPEKNVCSCIVPFVSYGNPEKLENMVETEKHSLKECVAVFIELFRNTVTVSCVGSDSLSE